MNGKANEQNSVGNNNSNVEDHLLCDQTSLSIVIDMKTSMDIWIGKPDDYSRLHTFESHVYMMYNIR